MTSEATIASPPRPVGWDAAAGLLRRHWPLVIGLAALVVPSLIRLAEQSWSTEAGAHAPIVLATGIWLLTRGSWAADPAGQAKWGGWAIAALALIALPIYIFGRAYDFLSLEAGAVYLAVLLAGIAMVGPATLWRNAFPLFYLAFLIPIPGWIIDQVTAPLQHLISWSATELLAALGYPVSRSGVSIFIAQYQLLVEQACSGMNSLIGLTAITLFYIYVLHRASWRYALLLVALILPVAVVANFIRVLILILLTYYYGDAVAQGFLHNSAGILLFATALMMMILLDATLRRFVARRRAA